MADQGLVADHGPDAGEPVAEPGRARGRVLVAVLLEGSVADEVSGIRRAVTGSTGHLGPHVTLVPPRNLAPPALPAAFAVLREAAAASAPLALELGPPATFSRGRSVLYLAVGGDLAGLEALRAAVTREPLGAPAGREMRAFVPHVTLGSGLDGHRAELLAEQLSAYRASVTCATVSLLEEVVSPAGRRWEVLSSEALGGRSVRARGGLALEVSLAERLDPEVAAVVKEAWAAYGRATYGRDVRVDRPFAFVARRDGRIVGAATGECRDETCELSRLVVVAAERGLGTGSRLLEAVERYATEVGCERVRLRTLAEGPARGLYERRGFEVTAPLTRWRSGRDFVLMERRLR